MLKGCRTLPQAARRTKVQRANARFLSSGRVAAVAPALSAAARAAAAPKVAASQVSNLSKSIGKGGSEESALGWIGGTMGGWDDGWMADARHLHSLLCFGVSRFLASCLR